MTREEVIEKLNELKIIFEDCMVDAEGDRDAAEALKNNQDSAKALDIAIKALEQEPCEDAISRQEVLDILDDTVKDYIKENDFDKAQGVAWVKAQKLPSVTPQPKTGQWINIEDRTDWYDTSYKCSCCGREIITPYDFKNNLYSDYPYCHCGARMVGSQESEEKTNDSCWKEYYESKFMKKV